MQPLPNEARTRNVSMRESCDYCLNAGLVVTNLRPSRTPDKPFEETGPCPFCERGFTVEFPDKPEGGPWGVDGFWRGRDPSAFAALTKLGGGRTLSVLTNRERLEELTERLERARQEREQAERASHKDSRGEVGDLADRALPQQGEVKETQSTVDTARDPLPEPPPSETGLFG